MSRPNFYAGSGLDRASRLRGDQAWVEARLGDAGSRIVPIWRNQNFFMPPGAAKAAPRPALPSLAELGDEVRPALGSPELTTALLGLDGDVAYFAVDLSAIEDQGTAAALLGGGGEFVDLRRYGPLLERRAGAILAYSRGLMHWHARHRFCGACGAPTVSAEAGHQRRCTNPSCALAHFPRTDPAVIMLVTDGERCLLGRQASWPAGMHSTLAGFVEPGESLEEAVAREVFEEAGVRVVNVRYHSSQPWPFPGSIMLGFHADAVTAELAIDRSELEEARWYWRDELLASPEDDTLRLPRRDSIARRLIETWLGRE